jgi:LacI family transcriptional regulator
VAAAKVRDVAAAAGVSVGTVSNVLNRPDQVPDATVQRVRRAITDLGYVPNHAARQLRMGQSRAVGLVVLDISNPFFADVFRGAEHEASASGLMILVGESDNDPRREEMYMDLFEEHRVRGLLICPLGQSNDRLAKLRSKGIPSVIVGRKDPAGQFASVSFDEEASGYLAARHLIEQGKQRIAFVGGPQSIRQIHDRLTGARRAVSEEPDATLEVIGTNGLSVQQGLVIGERIIERSTSHRPDAVFAANDLVALGVIQSFVMQASLRVPEDIAVIGCDDISFAQSAVVSLSSVRAPGSTLGQMAVKMLLAVGESERPDGQQQVVFQTELVIRESSRR